MEEEEESAKVLPTLTEFDEEFPAKRKISAKNGRNSFSGDVAN
jgi:hypothetical protein